MRRRSPLQLGLLLTLVALLVGAAAALAQDTGSESYTVVLGDVLDRIAARYDVQLACLLATNDIKTGRGYILKPGDTLIIDYSCPRYDGVDFVPNPRGGDAGSGGGRSAAADTGRRTAQPGPNDEVYVVKPNDTLDTIAQRFNISLLSLRLANGFTQRRVVIYVGDELVIPSGAPPYGAFPALVNPTAKPFRYELGSSLEGQGGGAGGQTYVVQPRDVLDLIAAAYDVQVACLIEANELPRPYVIYAGQTLLIPTGCPPYDGLAPVGGPRA
jgi:LysM repeat protein